jgi:hypothetical protein
MAAARSREEANSQFRARGRDILSEAKRTAEEQERAVVEARQRCEALEAQLRETRAALDAVEEAARAHARVNDRMDAHLSDDVAAGESGPARGG